MKWENANRNNQIHKSKGSVQEENTGEAQAASMIHAKLCSPKSLFWSQMPAVKSSGLEQKRMQSKSKFISQFEIIFRHQQKRQHITKKVGPISW